MTEASRPSPMPAVMARVNSLTISPACRATMVAPTIVSVPRRTCTFTKPSSSPSATARSTSAKGRRYVSTAIARLEADVGDLGVGVRAPRDGEGGVLLAPEEERVLDHHPGRRVGRVGELLGHADVAGGVDARIGRLEPVVHLDAIPPVVGDADRLEAEALHVGHAPRAHEDLVHLDPDRSARRRREQDCPAARALDPLELGAEHEADAFAHEGALDDLRRVRVFAVQDMVAGVEEGHLGAQAPEGLRQLAADGAGPDDGEARRPLRQLEHALVGEKTRLAETG